jgi:tol-pal system protein YbgF
MRKLVNGVRIAAAAAFVAAVVFPLGANAERLSLAERVAALEQQAAAGRGNMDLVNQVQSLQSQVQQLQGQVEELRHQLDEAKERNKQQYIDLDSRLGRVEGRAPGSAPGGNAPANNGHLEDIQLGAPQGDVTGNGTVPAPDRFESAPPRDDRAAPVEERLPGSDPNRGAPIEDRTPAPAPRLDPAAEKAAYDDAFGALKDGRYAESARRFQSFIEAHPNGELTPNAYYWLGESYYVTQNYRMSQDAFSTLLKKYPDSQKAPDALLKTGYCQYEMKQWDAAEATLNKVVQKYPDTTVARLAQGRLRALKLEGKR